MRFGVLFLVLGAALAALAWEAGGRAFGLLWPATSFLVVGTSYVLRRPGILGKRGDGTLAMVAFVPLGPYFLLAWSIWIVQRALTREEAANEVAPGLWVGRRPLAAEIPAPVRHVVDLTAELPAAEAVRAREGYLCAPVLDGTSPDAATLALLVARLRHLEGVLVHCVAGHGRSATLAAALLIERGIARDVDEAEALMRRRRPGIRLSSAQREAVRALPASTRGETA